MTSMIMEHLTSLWQNVDLAWYGAILFRLFLASLLAGIAGANRRRTAHPAGLRTHLIISLASCLLMLVSLEMSHIIPGYVGDPGRIAAQVVTGIGFLGAGAILRLGFSVRGLTTAASLWMCSGIGLAVGAGMYFMSIAAAALLYLALTAVDKLESRWLSKSQLCKLCVTARGDSGVFDAVLKILTEWHIRPDYVSLSRNFKKARGSITAFVSVPSDEVLVEIEESIAKVEGVESISWNEE